MKENIAKAIEVLAERAEKADVGIEAQQYAQAVVNLMNALACLLNQK